MKKKNKISSKDDLAKSLDLNKIEDLKDNPIAQVKLAANASNIDIGLLSEVISMVPALAGEISKVISTMTEIGNSIEETKRIRWTVIRDLSKNGTLDKDNILEAMRIISDIEKNEGIDYNELAKIALRIFGVTMFVAVTIIAGGSLSNKEKSS